MSSSTSDVLIPRQETCVPCHGAQAVKTPTACITCHMYHDRSKLLTASALIAVRRGRSSALPTGDVTGMLYTLLLCAALLLMLFVAIPIALAVYRHFRVAAERSIASARESAAPAPVTPPMPEPAVARQATVSQTVAAPYVEIPAAVPATEAAAPPPTDVGRTDLVQWHGRLVCTAGPLEGRGFVIIADGLWLGRDPEFAQVVIDDARVSKRHVRIVPRDTGVHAIDTESRNGTYINKVGERITDVVLSNGDTIILGDNVAAFRYQA